MKEEGDLGVDVDSEELFQLKVRKDLEYWYRVLKIGAILAPLMYVVVHVIYFSKFDGEISSENGDWGTFGDFIGGSLNPIFSLLAFLALVYTIKLQGVELRNSASQLRKSADALSLQNSLWERQNFESTFFNLLDNQRRIREGVRFRVARKGQSQVFDFSGAQEHVDEFTLNIKALAEVARFDEIQSREGFHRVVKNQMDLFFSGEGNYLIPIVEGIVLLVQFIDRSRLSYEDKIFYMNVAKKQLRISELKALFFYSFNFSQEKIDLMIKYGVCEIFNLTDSHDCVLSRVKMNTFKTSR